jgi:hypothetical protein
MFMTGISSFVGGMHEQTKTQKEDRKQKATHTLENKAQDQLKSVFLSQFAPCEGFSRRAGLEQPEARLHTWSTSV